MLQDVLRGRLMYGHGVTGGQGVQICSKIALRTGTVSFAWPHTFAFRSSVTTENTPKFMGGGFALMLTRGEEGGLTAKFADMICERSHIVSKLSYIHYVYKS